MKRNSLFTKIAALMLCVMMVIGCLPVSAFAANYVEGEMDVMETKATLLIGDNELKVYTGMATTIYTYNATAEGTLSITMPNYIGWSYELKNGADVKKSSTADAEVIANPSIDVKNGDVVTLTVTTNGPTKPVTTKIVASFEEAQGTAVNPYEVNIDSFRNYFVVYANKTANFVVTSDNPEYGGTTEFQGNMIISTYGVNFSGYCGRMPITPVIDELGYYIATVPVQYNAGMIIPQFTIDAAEEVGVNIRFEVPVGTNLNPADMNVGSVEEPGVNTSTAEYWFRYYAGENGTVTIKMTSETWAYIAEYVNTSDVVKNSGTIYSDTADAQSTLVYEVVAGDRINIMLMPYNADSASFNAWFEAEAEEPEETDPPVETVPVAKIGETGYATVAEALNAAEAGQTVTMIANSGSADAKEGILIIKPNVTLNLGSYSLYAENLIGLNDSLITADPETSDTALGGQLYVHKNNISLDSGSVTLGDYQIVPVMVDDNHFVFAEYRHYNAECVIDTAANTATPKFQTNFKKHFRTKYFSQGECADHGVSFIITVGYSIQQDAGVVKVSTEYFYTAGLLKGAMMNSRKLNCLIENCDQMIGFYCRISMVTDAGVVVSTQDYTWPAN